MSETRYGGVAMRGGRLLAVAAVLVLGLVGCSEEQPASQTLPTTAVTTEATPTLEALGPPDLPMPAEAREQTPAGAEAFIRYYLALINQTNMDMTSVYLRKLSRDCSTCERISNEVDADSLAGYRYEGGELTVDGELQAALTSETTAEAAFIADQALLTINDSTGQAVPGLTINGADNLSSGSIVTWDAGRRTWTMTELTLG